MDDGEYEYITFFEKILILQVIQQIFCKLLFRENDCLH